MPGKRNATHRRGLAMMMVLISLALATILASAYLASRDNSLIIGRNSTAAASARWSALSALETSVAILQTQTDWRTSHTGGVLLDSYPLAGAAVTITVRDLETGAPPTAATEYVEVTARATVDIDGDGNADGIQETKFEAYVPTVAGNRVALDLSEFAVFVEHDIIMSGSSTIARWSTAPLSGLGRRVKLGTQGTGSSDVDVRDTAACIDTTVYYQAGASSSIVANATGPPILEVQQPFEIPFWPGPPPGVPDPDGSTPPDLCPGTGDTVTLTSDVRFDDIVVEEAELILQGDITVVCDDLLEIDDQSKCYVDGNVTLVAFGDFEVKDYAFIELLDGATLTVFVGDDVLLRNGYVGEQRADGNRDHTGNAPHMDPLRIRIYSIDHTAVDYHTWVLEQNSVIKGSIYGKPVRLNLYGDSAIYGRVATYDLDMWNNSGLFYDHALDEQQGYTNNDSLLINDATGDLATAYLTLASLDPASVQALADATETYIFANGTTTAPTSAVPPEPPGPGDPTPRPVPVQYAITTFGMDMSEWERSHADPAVPAGGGGGGGGKQQVN